VEESSAWYQKVFDCISKHGGSEFDVLVSKDDQILICLHKWGAHEHPTMENDQTTPGNGLILYMRTENINKIRQNLRDLNYEVEEEIQLNPYSGKHEFSLRDPNGYYLTISKFHKF